jgi:hypothetical protein
MSTFDWRRKGSNSKQTAVNVLPIDMKVPVVKIHKYFHIYTMCYTVEIQKAFSA